MEDSVQLRRKLNEMLVSHQKIPALLRPTSEVWKTELVRQIHMQTYQHYTFVHYYKMPVLFTQPLELSR